MEIVAVFKFFFLIMTIWSQNFPRFLVRVNYVRKQLFRHIQKFTDVKNDFLKLHEIFLNEPGQIFIGIHFLMFFLVFKLPFY